MKLYYLTEPEVNFINANKGVMKKREIAAALNRPYSTIYRHLSGRAKLKRHVPHLVKVVVEKPYREPKNIDQLLNFLSKEYAY